LSPNDRTLRRAAAPFTLRQIFKRGALIALLFVAASLAPHVAAARAQAAQQKLRITTASGVRVRTQPETGAGETAKLPVGTVVGELERSPQKAKVGAAEDYWYMVSTPEGARGWVFGNLTAPFDAARREEIYQSIADERLANKSASFADLVDLVRFLDRATKELTRRDAVAGLEFARLSALARSLSAIPADQHDNPTYKQWTTERDKEVVYSEPSGQWYVRAELLWDLQKKYRDLPVGERIAWEAAETPLPGECEGDLGCTLYYASATHGTYLALYPHGPHAGAALDAIAETFKYVTDDIRGTEHVYQVSPEEKADFRKTVATLRGQLNAAASPKSAQLLKQLEEIARHFG
jgi:Bacterial SH3 domain